MNQTRGPSVHRRDRAVVDAEAAATVDRHIRRCARREERAGSVQQRVTELHVAGPHRCASGNARANQLLNRRSPALAHSPKRRGPGHSKTKRLKRAVERRGRDSSPRWTEPPEPVFETDTDRDQTLRISREFVTNDFAVGSPRESRRTEAERHRGGRVAPPIAGARALAPAPPDAIARLGPRIRVVAVCRACPRVREVTGHGVSRACPLVGCGGWW
jgi:hypothetical protein